MKAIRICGKEVLHGNCHVNLVLTYRDREKLSDDATDIMIDSGEIEFGSVYLDSKTGTLLWRGDEARDAWYRGEYCREDA